MLIGLLSFGATAITIIKYGDLYTCSSAWKEVASLVQRGGKKANQNLRPAKTATFKNKIE